MTAYTRRSAGMEVQNLGPAEGAWQMQEREEGEMSGGFEWPDSPVGGANEDADSRMFAI